MNRRDIPAATPPAPRRGKLGDASYAEHYARSHHVDPESLAYRAEYADLLTIDALMPEGYRLLDIGCGSAGYHRLLARHGRVHGIDPIPEMIAAAEKFRTEFGLRSSEYTCASFETFAATGDYDVIRACGVFGWYLPWTGRESVLDKIAALLAPAGVAALTYVPPDSSVAFAKAVLAPHRTVVLRRRDFHRMLRLVSLEPMLEMRLKNATMVFARKGAAAER